MVDQKDSWNSRIGVILAVSGSAVGLGNFLRFPGQAAQNGGGAFMLAYFISFLIIGLPICWAEWTMGRYGGQRGFNSCPGILNAIWRHPAAKYLGIIGVIIPIIIYMYYVYIEAWCLGYAVNFVVGNMDFNDVGDAGEFWGNFIGIGADGDAFGFGIKNVGVYLLLVFVLNFFLIYRGIAKGIELFCKYAMPTLLIIALIILVRVLTLGAPVSEQPENNIGNGLGFMWNPNKVILQEKTIDSNSGEITWVDRGELVGKTTLDKARAEVAENPDQRLYVRTIGEQLLNPQVWLAAAGQIFFSLSVGFGIIMTYASYLSKKDDLVLSGLAATSANEFCEVGLGGLITVPAGFAFLGVAGVAGQSTFGLGFNVLPMVFSEMPLGTVFGFLFFFLLFLAAVTSSISMLQPGIAFLEETLNINRRQSVALLGLITAMGCLFVVYFSKDVKALDTLDFWVGTFLIFILATIQIIIFGWSMGLEKGFSEAHQGAIFHIPAFFKVIMKYICPLFLLTIFVLWVLVNIIGLDFATGQSSVPTYVNDLFGEEKSVVAWLSIAIILSVAIFFAIIVSRVRRYSIDDKDEMEGVK